MPAGKLFFTLIGSMFPRFTILRLIPRFRFLRFTFYFNQILSKRKTWTPNQFKRLHLYKCNTTTNIGVPPLPIRTCVPSPISTCAPRGPGGDQPTSLSGLQISQIFRTMSPRQFKSSNNQNLILQNNLKTFSRPE